MSDPPGKMLSSLAPCSEKRSSKLGGCAGVFFQLFDWNRRLNGKRFLSRKLLPAERPIKHASKHHMDEKLPMAKLLLIADENRGGFPRALPNNAGEVFMKEKTPEKKKNKRGPSVVAKLMGLETMPSPEPSKDWKQGKANLPKLDENCDPKAPSFRAKSAAVDKRISVQSSIVPHSSSRLNSSHVSSSQNASISCDSLHAKSTRAMVSHKSDDPKVSFFCKLPTLSPRKAEGAFRSILSPSKSHNKMLSPIKSPLSTKRAARLLEAAAKILEPSMQPSIRARGLAINSQAARSLLISDAKHEDQKSGDTVSRPHPSGPKKKALLASDAKKQQQSAVLHIYADQPKAQTKLKQDKKPANVLDSTAACKSQVSISNRRVPYLSSNQESLRRSGSTKEESACQISSSAGQQRLMRSKSVKDDPEQGKPNYFNQNVTRIAKEDKGKTESRKQQQICNRISQPGVGVKKRGLNLTTTDEHPVDAENQNPNIIVLSTHIDTRQITSTDSVVTTSSSNSGILNYSRLFGSRKAAPNDEPSKKAHKKGDSSVMKSFLRKKSVTSDNLTKSGSKAVLKESSQVSKGGKAKSSEKPLPLDSQTDSNSLTLSCFTEERFVDIGDPTEMASSAFASSLDSTRADLEIPDISDESCKKSTTSNNAKQEHSSDSSDVVSSLSSCTTLMHSDVGALELSIQNDCELSGGDSASSSYVCLEFSKHRKKKPVSYSGKTTAAILQELLMALNSAKTQVDLDESMQNMSDSNECVSSSKFTLCAQLGDDCDDSASSAVVLSDDLRTTPMAMRRYNSSGEYSDEWRHPSPVSTLEFPSEDSSSALSDNFEDAQERKLLSRVLPKNHHGFVSRRHYIDLPLMGVESKVYKEAFECEEQYVKDVVRTAKLSPFDIYAMKLQLPSCALLDPTVFTNLEDQFYQQWEWGVTPDNMYARCRSEIDTRFTRSLYVEAGVQNRKLVFECINEALNMQLGINEHHSRQNFSQSVHSSSRRHISQSVCTQMEAWRRMSCCMNIDDMVDQEMNTGFGKWIDFSDEVSDFAVEMEGNIVLGLIDELVKDLGRRQSSRKECIRVSW